MRWRLKVLSGGVHQLQPLLVPNAPRCHLHRARLLTACYIDASIPQGHPLTEFDGCKRSCRRALQKHNERRCVAGRHALQVGAHCVAVDELACQNWKSGRASRGVPGVLRLPCCLLPSHTPGHWLLLYCHAATCSLPSFAPLPPICLPCRRVKPNSTGSGGSAGAAQPADGSAAAAAAPPAAAPQLLPMHLGAPSLVTSAAASLVPPPPAFLPPPAPLQLGGQPPLFSGSRCAAAAAVGGPLPQEVAHARAQMEALRLTQQPNQWVLLPQSLLEQHVPQLLAAALSVHGLAGPQQAAVQPPPQPLLVRAPLPAPRIRAPGYGPQLYSLLQGEFDGSGI